MIFNLFPDRVTALVIGDYVVRWYGVMYVLAYALVLFLGYRLTKYRQIKIIFDDFLVVVTIGIVGMFIGGRLGYVLFYEPSYYLSHLSDILAIWQGGMSAHGGVIGAAIGLLIGARWYKLNVWLLADILVVPAALGLALGRFGNFINQELYGTVTTLSWGMVFPGADGLRHPTQLYEMLTNILLAGLAYWQLRRSNQKPGQVTLVFLGVYSLIRFSLEFVRADGWPPVNTGGMLVSRGQALSFIFIILTVSVYLWRKKNLHNITNS